MLDFWQPVDLEETDRNNKLDLLIAIRDGRCRPIPDQDNPGCIVFVYDLVEGDDYYVDGEQETSCEFVDEVVDLREDGLITFGHDYFPSIADDGVAYLYAETETGFHPVPWDALEVHPGSTDGLPPALHEDDGDDAICGSRWAGSLPDGRSYGCTRPPGHHQRGGTCRADDGNHVVAEWYHDEGETNG